MKHRVWTASLANRGQSAAEISMVKSERIAWLDLPPDCTQTEIRLLGVVA